MKRPLEKEDDDSDEEIWSYSSRKRKRNAYRSKDLIKTDGQTDTGPTAPIFAQPQQPRLCTARVTRELNPQPGSQPQPQPQPQAGSSLSGLATSKVKFEKRKTLPVGLPRKSKREIKSVSPRGRNISSGSPKMRSENHKSRRLKLKLTQSQTDTNPTSRPTPSTSKSVLSSTKKKKASVSIPPREGNCPACQLPFRCLREAENPIWHVTDCMNHTPSYTSMSQEECPEGRQCDSTIQSHYKKYRHTELANLRAGQQPEMAVTEGFSNVANVVRQLDFDSTSLSYPVQDRSTEKKTVDCMSEGDSDEDIFTTNEPKEKDNNDETVIMSSTGEFEQKEIPPNVDGSTDSDSLFHKDVSDMLHDICNEEPDRPDPSVCLSQADDDNLWSDSWDYDATDQVEGNEESQEKDKPENPCSDSEDHDQIVEQALAKPFTKDPAYNSSLAEISKNKENESIAWSESWDYDAIDSVEWNKESQEKEEPGQSTPSTSLIHSTPSPKGHDKGLTIVRHSKVSSITPSRSTQKKGRAMSMQRSRIEDFFSQSSSSVKKTQEQTSVNSVANSWQSSRPSTSKTGTVPATASLDGGSTRGGIAKGKGVKRSCPFYKKIPGTPFTVDAFKYGSIPGCRAYILSHFHYDHYGGLTKRFTHPIYCSKITANLVKKKVGVEEKYLHVLALDTPTFIEGVEVTFMEANHCPGAVIIHFKLANRQMFLHTGDFRACRAMERYLPLVDTHIHQLYLDTTYCDPAYSFPPQQEVIKFAARLALESLQNDPETLVVVGSYTIGKERIFIAIAEALNSCVCVTREKMGILECLEDASLSKRLTMNPQEAKVHVLPMSQLNIQSLKTYLDKLRPRFKRVLAIKPTGWTHSIPRKNVSLEKMRPQKWGNVSVYGLPYSEHSSYTEMKRFCQVIRPDKILPTVNNGSADSRNKMGRLFRQWMKEDLVSPCKQLKLSRMKGWVQPKKE